MKTLVQHIYSFKELDDEAKDQAIENLCREAGEDPYLLEHVSSEMLDSLEAVCSGSGVRLTNYSFGSYDRNHFVRISHYDYEDLEGKRALAWFLRILINHGYDRPKRFKEMQFPGICGFTGVCYDEDIVETIWEYLLDGSTVAQAFDGVSGKLCSMLEAEGEYLASKEAILEMLDENEERFDKEGNLI